jgi:hypothetical protein
MRNAIVNMGMELNDLQRWSEENGARQLDNIKSVRRQCLRLVTAKHEQKYFRCFNIVMSIAKLNLRIGHALAVFDIPFEHNLRFRVALFDFADAVVEMPDVYLFFLFILFLLFIFY